jgi:hypothetical protein
MRMNRRLVMVIGLVHVRVQERGVQRPDRHGCDKQPCHDPAPRQHGHQSQIEPFAIG